MDRKDQAAQLKRSLNCCQAVLCAYAEETGLPMETLKKIGAAFGGGMGGMKGNCGALCGAELVLGILKSEGGRIHKPASALYDSFEEKCGSTICKELKGFDTGKVLCSCEDCVRNAVAALEEIL